MMSYNAHCFIFLPNRMRHPVHLITQCAIIISFGFFNLFPLFKMWQLLLSVHSTRGQETNLIDTTICQHRCSEIMYPTRELAARSGTPPVQFYTERLWPPRPTPYLAGFIQGSYKKLQPFFKDFSITFQGQPTRNIISQTVQKCIFPVYFNKTFRLDLFASPTSLHLFTCLKLIV